MFNLIGKENLIKYNLITLKHFALKFSIWTFQSDILIGVTGRII